MSTQRHHRAQGVVAGVPAGLWDAVMQIFMLGSYFKHCLTFIAGNRLTFYTVEVVKTKREQELGWFSDTESACSAGSMASPQLLSPFLWKTFWLS